MPVSEPNDSRTAFLGWQCRVRQWAVRRHDGRPTEGMRPKLVVPGAGQSSRVVVLIHKLETAATTARFRHMAKRTQDPAERHDAALKFLADAHYQSPESFRDELTAVYSLDSAFAAEQDNVGHCVLVFSQHGHQYTLPCLAERLSEGHELYQSSYWHNLLFNPALPGRVSVVRYRPEWERMEYRQYPVDGPPGAE